MISNVSFPKIIEEQIIEKNNSSELMIPYVLKSIRQLEKAEVDFIVLPCNTLHEIMPILRKETTIPIFDLVDETAKVLTKYNRIGIIASTRTKESKIYNQVSNQTEIIYPTDEEQDIVSRIIIKIIRKTNKEEDKLKINRIISNLKERGAERVILGCTDLANIIKKDDFLIDTQEVLINAIKREMVI